MFLLPMSWWSRSPAHGNIFTRHIGISPATGGIVTVVMLFLVRLTSYILKTIRREKFLVTVSC